ncbi:MAG: hypothetical protein ACTTGJ_01590 [Clostridium sp.]
MNFNMNKKYSINLDNILKHEDIDKYLEELNRDVEKLSKYLNENRKVKDKKISIDKTILEFLDMQEEIEQKDNIFKTYYELYNIKASINESNKIDVKYIQRRNEIQERLSTICIEFFKKYYQEISKYKDIKYSRYKSIIEYYMSEIEELSLKDNIDMNECKQTELYKLNLMKINFYQLKILSTENMDAQKVIIYTLKEYLTKYMINNIQNDEKIKNEFNKLCLNYKLSEKEFKDIFKEKSKYINKYKKEYINYLNESTNTLDDEEYLNYIEFEEIIDKTFTIFEKLEDNQNTERNFKKYYLLKQNIINNIEEISKTELNKGIPCICYRGNIDISYLLLPRKNVNKYYSIVTIAHELGHAFNNYYMYHNNRYNDRGLHMIVTELIAITIELLMYKVLKTEYILKKEYNSLKKLKKELKQTYITYLFKYVDIIKYERKIEEIIDKIIPNRLNIEKYIDSDNEEVYQEFYNNLKKYYNDNTIIEYTNYTLEETYGLFKYIIALKYAIILSDKLYKELQCNNNINANTNTINNNIYKFLELNKKNIFEIKDIFNDMNNILGIDIYKAENINKIYDILFTEII